MGIIYLNDQQNCNMEGAEKSNDHHSSVKPVPTEIFILKELYLKRNQTPWITEEIPSTMNYTLTML